MGQDQVEHIWDNKRPQCKLQSFQKTGKDQLMPRQICTARAWAEALLQCVQGGDTVAVLMLCFRDWGLTRFELAAAPWICNSRK